LATALERPDARVASALVDIRSGLLVRVLGGGTSEHLELAGSITPEILGSNYIEELRDLFGRLGTGETRGSEDYFREAMVVSDSLVFVIQRLKQRPSLAVVTLHPAGHRLGLLLAEARRHLLEAELLAEKGGLP
jgi:hypothetical protein